MKRMISAVILISMATLLPARGFFERASGRVVGNGDFQTREVDLAPFAQAEVGGGIALDVERGPRQVVTVRAESNVLRYVQLSVTGNVLRVRFEPGVSLGNHGVRVTVRIPSIEGVDASGGSSVRLGRGVAAETFRSVLSGGAYLRGELLVETASLRGSGGAQMELTGRCGELDLSAGGGGRFLLEGLEAGRVEVDLSGGARARVWASEELTVGLSGGSGLGYRGSPRMEIRSVSGGSSIERI